MSNRTVLMIDYSGDGGIDANVSNITAALTSADDHGVLTLRLKLFQMLNC